MDKGYLRLHAKLLWEPDVSIVTMVSAAQQAYDAAAIKINLVSVEKLTIPGIDPENFPVGDCNDPIGPLTPEQSILYGYRGSALQNDVVAFLVRTMDGSQEGCSTHPIGIPCLILSSIADLWLLGHEVGHLLGLTHVPSSDYLMCQYGTSHLTKTPPLLDPAEIDLMRHSDLVTYPSHALEALRSVVLSHAPVGEKLSRLPADAEQGLSLLADESNPLVASQAVLLASYRMTAAGDSIVDKGLAHQHPSVRLSAVAALKRRSVSRRPASLQGFIKCESDPGVKRLLRDLIKKPQKPAATKKTQARTAPRS